MKARISLSLLAVALLSTTGCFSYERRTVEPVVVAEPTVTTEKVVTVLPTGYHIHVVNGTRYYYYNSYYYRTAPNGYYVTTVRPW